MPGRARAGRDLAPRVSVPRRHASTDPLVDRQDQPSRIRVLDWRRRARDYGLGATTEPGDGQGLADEEVETAPGQLLADEEPEALSPQRIDDEQDTAEDAEPDDAEPEAATPRDGDLV